MNNCLEWWNIAYIFSWQLPYIKCHIKNFIFIICRNRNLKVHLLKVPPVSEEALPCIITLKLSNMAIYNISYSCDKFHKNLSIVFRVMSIQEDRQQTKIKSNIILTFISIKMYSQTKVFNKYLNKRFGSFSVLLYVYFV